MSTLSFKGQIKLGSEFMKLQPEHETNQNVELFTLWAHVGSNNGFLAANQFFYNNVEDLKLKIIINDFTTCLKDENQHLERLLKEKGTSLTPSFVRVRPQYKAISSGENQTDLEISAALSMNIATSLVTTSKALGQAKSEYTLLMYGHFHMKKAILGAKLLHLSKEKCWLSVSQQPNHP